MALIRQFPQGGGGAVINLYSDGWSGEVVHRRPNGVTPMYFQFDYDFTWDGDQPYYGIVETLSNNRGFVRAGNDSIIGISLEHMGLYVDGNNDNNIQFVGIDSVPDWDTPTPSWGGNDTDGLNIYSDDIYISHYKIQDPEDGTETEYTTPNQIDVHFFVLRSLYFRYQYISGAYVTNITTDLPIFETDADLLEYCESGGTVTNKILNLADEPTPEEKYNEQFKYHYIKNIWGHNTRTATAYSDYRNYRLFPKSQRMCFYRVPPTSSSPYTITLLGATGATVKGAPAYAYNDDDYEVVSQPEMLYIHKSISFSDNDYYSVFQFQTDLLIFGTEQEAQDYIDGTGDPRGAENWNEVSRAYDEIVDPGFGDPDEGDDNGYNGQYYGDGACFWKLEQSDLTNFFSDVFSPGNLSDFLTGTQIFGDNQISAIGGLAFYPFDVDDVATLYPTKQTIKVGSWSCPTAEGRRILSNQYMIDCGSIFLARPYNDYRDWDIKIYISLPYIGVRELRASAYIGRTLSVKYAVDLCSGAATAHLFANGGTLGGNIEIDSYDGYIACQRPIASINQQTYINAIMGNVSSIINRETGMIDTATNSIVGVATGQIGVSTNNKGEVNGYNAPSSGVGPGGALNLSLGAIGDIYGLVQAKRDIPMETRGGYSGALGMFGPQKIHILTAQRATYRSPNERSIIGLPSGIGGRVGMFSGFLSVSVFKASDNFPGTAWELAKICEIMKKGIYI